MSRLFGRTLIARENGLLRNLLGALALLVLLPLLLLGVIVALLLKPFEKPAKRSAQDVAACLRDFLQDAGDEGYWDYFISVRLADPELEAIRLRARDLDLPLDEEGREMLGALIAEAEALAAHDEAGGTGLDSVTDRA